MEYSKGIARSAFLLSYEMSRCQTLGRGSGVSIMFARQRLTVLPAGVRWDSPRIFRPRV
jgi:hypothetical protein